MYDTPRIQQFPVGDVFRSVARHVQHTHVGAQRSEPFGQFPAGAQGHDHIRKHQVNRARVTFGQKHGFTSLRGLQNPVAIVFQHADREPADRLLIFHH
jgi:hypothetical protein